MKSEEKLSACPHCGSTSAPNVATMHEVFKDAMDVKAEYADLIAVVCNGAFHGCGSASGFCATTDDAIKLWNERAAIAKTEMKRSATVDAKLQKFLRG